MGKYDEMNSMKRMMGLKGPTNRQREKKKYNRQHQQLSDQDVAGIEGQLGNDMSTEDVRRRRKSARVQSIFGQVTDAYGLGG